MKYSILSNFHTVFSVIDLVKVLYTISMLALAVYGIYSFILLVFWFTRGRKSGQVEEGIDKSDWPMVTIQLPVYNEGNVVPRLLKSITALDYPKDLLQIQVLDDSTDNSTNEIKKMVEFYADAGFDIKLIHRNVRTGFKAGALSEGLKEAKGEYIAIFDADFLPSQDWLKRVLPALDDKTIGFVQTRWGHLNADYNLLTRIIAFILNGHFYIEQSARSSHGLFMGFNGTAGVWRKSCIDDAGGWQADTLTEDLDLSYRAQLHGWKSLFLPGVEVPAELPVTIQAFKQQQYRWAKGGIQTAKKLFPRLAGAKISRKLRWMGFVHLWGYLIFAFSLMAFLALIPLSIYSSRFLDLFLFTLITSFGPPLVYLSAASVEYPRLVDRLKALPGLMVVASGLSINNTFAVLEGLFSNKVGEFDRTPKFDIIGTQNRRILCGRLEKKVDLILIGEVAAFVYALLGIGLLISLKEWTAIPWVTVYALGFGYMIFGDSFVYLKLLLGRENRGIKRNA